MRDPIRYSPSTLNRRAGAVRPRHGAFTMVEALVAIGAMAVVAVGIAAIFQSVGKTVSGGRRLSVLNGYAAMIEQQMRREFANMTRDGFLVIRNQYADANGDKNFSTNDDRVAVSPTDATPRPRRVDEIMFIAKGDYTSAREPLDPSYVAHSQFARMYFGHGLRLPAQARNNAYAQPQTNDDNRDAPRFGRVGPNQYAKDWTLLRHATLLVRPETATQWLPANKVFAWDPTKTSGRVLLSDKDGQIALQPGATSLFRAIARFKTGVVNTTNYVRGSEQSTPGFASGIVDIATTDLSEIRGVVHCLNMSPNTVTPVNYPPNLPGFTGWTFSAGPQSLAMSKQWMDDAWPTPSNLNGPGADSGTRIRCEPGPTDYIATIAGAGAATLVQSAYRRGDQLALSASNFITGCTEFIVEYSFGVTDPNTGALLWHGMERRVDQNADGVITAQDPLAVRPYPLALDGASRPFRLEYQDQLGKWHSDDATKLPYAGSAYAVPVNLFNDGGTSSLVSTSFFGYVDPTSTDGRPWAWPTLIRVTLSLTDPNNPGVEETFQFVFPTSGNPT